MPPSDGAASARGSDAARRDVVELALRFRFRCQCFHTGSPGPRQHPFGSGHSSRIRPVIPRTADGGADPHALRFPAAFRLPALASRAIRYPPGDWAFLTVDLPGTTSSPDPDGITTFHTRKIQPGRVPPVSRGRRYSPGRSEVLDRRLPLFDGQPLHPAQTTHQRGSIYRDINGGSRDSPVRSCPGL